MRNLTCLETNRGFRFWMPAGLIPYQEQRIRADGVYEPETEAAIHRFVQPGMTVIECGACCGYHALNIAAAVGEKGTVHCFEANPELMPVLEKNVRMNGFSDRVRKINYGVWDRTTTMPFAVRRESAGRGSLGRLKNPLYRFTIPRWLHRRMHRAEIRSIIEIQVISLDDYFEGRSVDFLRMDVEGAEPNIIQGGQKLIERNRPAIILEWTGDRTRGDSDSSKLFRLLSDFGYHLYRLLPGSLSEIRSAADFRLTYQTNRRDVLCTQRPASQEG